jgi:outer membrane receptor protein involved in Fe transport
VLGGLLRQQSAMFENRLLAYAGLRFDSIRYRHRDEITPASSFTPYIPDYVVGQYINRDITEVKPNLGINYKISQGFRIFANYSESYFIDQGDTPLAIADPSYKSEIANGYDYGFKGTLLNERLSYTVSGFYINRENVSVDDIEESPPGSSIYVPVSRRDGNQLVRGYEADLNYLITDELSFLGSYGRVDSIYTDYGTAYPAAVGRSAQWVAPYNGSLNLKYTPRGGWAKGFSTNIGVTFVGATPTAAPNAGDTYVTDPRTGARTVVRTTGEWNLRAPSYQLWSLGLRYQIPSKSNTTHMLSVNVNNLFDEEYLRAGSSTATRLRGEHRAFYFTYTLNHKGTKF